MHRHYHLRCWTRFFAPAEEVWAYKTDVEGRARPGLLRLVCEPPGALTRALQADLGRHHVDARIALPGGLPGPRFPLEIEIEGRWSVAARAGDNALFHAWEHRRSLEQASDGCRYVDAITFAPKAAATRAVARLVEELLLQSHRAAARRFTTDARATAVAMLRVVPLEGEAWQEA